MSGLEVISGISAIIAIIDGSIQVWNRAKQDIKLNATFEIVANRLPILRDTLYTCQEHFQPIITVLPADVVKGISNTIKSSQDKAEKLRTIFEKTIPGENDQWYERYRKIAKRLGQGSRVEELMKAITQDTQNLVNYDTVKSAKPELNTKLEALVEELEAADPSLPSEDVASQTFNAYGGPQTINTGGSRQYVSSNTGDGTTHNYGGITGNPTFNFGSVPSGPVGFAGTYAHSSLQPVLTYVPRLEIEQKLQTHFPVTDDAQSVTEMRTAVVWGLGGVGKSQLVRNYVRAQRQQYQAVFWIEAGQRETIERDYLQIYKQLYRGTGQDSTNVTVRDAVAGVKGWLQEQRRRCLWVMDSADDIDDDQSGVFFDLNHFLPEALQLDRIITTRSSRIQDMSTNEAIRIQELSDEEAVQLFRKCARIEHTSESIEQQVQEIVQELGCLALAITLAGSYIRETPGFSSDLSRFLHEFRENRVRLLGQKAHLPVHQYNESVLSTWETSIRAVQRRSPMAANLMHLLAFLNFDDIFPALFTSSPMLPLVTKDSCPTQRVRLRDRFRWLLKGQKSSYSNNVYSSESSKPMRWARLLSAGEGVVEHHDISAAFKILQDYSLVSWQPDQEAYSIHKLVHAWGHDRLTVEQRQQWSLAVLELLDDVQRNHAAETETKPRLVPHIMANFTVVSLVCGSSFRMKQHDRDKISNIEDFLYKLGRWNDAYKLQAFLTQVQTNILGREHPDTLQSMNNLATVLYNQGQYEAVETMYRQTLRLQEMVLGPEHPDTLLSMNNLASALHNQGQYKAVETMYRQTLRLQEKVLGPEHPHTLSSISNLAIVLYNQGQYEAAETLYRQTLRLQEKVLGPEHPDTLHSMNNLAIVLEHQGKNEEAGMFFDEHKRRKEGVRAG